MRFWAPNPVAQWIMVDGLEVFAQIRVGVRLRPTRSPTLCRPRWLRSAGMPRLDGLSRRSAIFVRTETDSSSFAQVKGHNLPGTAVANLSDRITAVVERHC